MVCPHVTAIGFALTVIEMDEDDAAEPRGDGGVRGAHALPHGDGEPESEDFIEIETAPKIAAFMRGSRASLSIELDAHYGEVEFPVCSPQGARTVWMEDPDDPLVRRTRSMKAEREAVKAVEKWGFEPG